MTISPLPRRALIARILADPAEIIVIEAPAGMGKSWLLRQLQDTGRALHDVGAGPSPVIPDDPGPRGMIIAKRPEVQLRGLARAVIYGRTSFYRAEDLVFTRDDIAAAGLSPAVFTRSGGWPCLLPWASAEAPDPDDLTAFLHDEMLVSLSPAQIASLHAMLVDPRLRPDPAVLRGTPLGTAVLAPAVAAIRPALQAAAAQRLRELSQNMAHARAIARTQVALGLVPQAIETLQRVGATTTALQVYEAAGGFYTIHRFGPEACRRLLAGFPQQMQNETEALVLGRAMVAVKQGDVRLAQLIMRDFYGDATRDPVAFIRDARHFSFQARLFRLLPRIWEDADLTEADVAPVYDLLAEVPVDDDLRRGSIYNVVLDIYVRLRRFPEAEQVARQAAIHYARAGVPVLSFYIALHSVVIRLFMGEPLVAQTHVQAAWGWLHQVDDNASDARLLRLAEACVAFEMGQVDGLLRFIAEDHDAFVNGETWGSIVELLLTYGPQALALTQSHLAARALLDRWRVTGERSHQFSALIDNREILLMQNAGRWIEAAQKAQSLSGPITRAGIEGDAALAEVQGRGEVAIALLWLRHFVHQTPRLSGLGDKLDAMRGNTHLTWRQHIAVSLWQAQYEARQNNMAEAQTLLLHALGAMQSRGAVAILDEEAATLADLLRRKRLLDAVEHDPRLRRFLRQSSLLSQHVQGGVDSDRGAALGLTRQEMRAMYALIEGATNKEIAKLLGLSEATVKFHLKNLYRKLGCATRAEVRIAAAALDLTR